MLLRGNSLCLLSVPPIRLHRLIHPQLSVRLVTTFTAPAFGEHQPLHDLLTGLHRSWSTNPNAHTLVARTFLFCGALTYKQPTHRPAPAVRLG